MTVEALLESEPELPAGEARFVRSGEVKSILLRCEREGYLVVEVPEFRAAIRGRLAWLLEEAVERVLELRGACPPGVGASTDLEGSLRDQIYRARLLGAPGLMLALPSLEGITSRIGALDADDSATLRWWMGCTRTFPVRLYLDVSDCMLGVYLEPVTLAEALRSSRPSELGGSRQVVSEWVDSKSSPSSNPPDRDAVEAMNDPSDADEDVELHRSPTLPPSGSAYAECLSASALTRDDRSGAATEPTTPQALGWSDATTSRDEIAESADPPLPDPTLDTLAEETVLVAAEPLQDVTERDLARGAPEAFPDGEAIAGEAPELENHGFSAEPASEGPIDGEEPVALSAVATETADAEAAPVGAEVGAEVGVKVGVEVDAKEPVAAPRERARTGHAPMTVRGSRMDAAAPESLAPGVLAASTAPDLASTPPSSVSTAPDLASTPPSSVSTAPNAAAQPTLNPYDPSRPLNVEAPHAWRHWMQKLDAARGPKPLNAIEQLFINAYVPLNDAYQRGIAGAEAAAVLDSWSTSFARSYSEAFDAMRMRGRRPMMVLDIPEAAQRLARLHGARSVQLVLVDGMRFDVGARVENHLVCAMGQQATLTDRFLLWSALPSTTAQQLELIARGAEGLKNGDIHTETPVLVARGRQASTLRRVRAGSRELLKLDLVEARLGEPGGPIAQRLDQLAVEISDALSSAFARMAPRTLVAVFGDHGFCLDPTDSGSSTMKQGGASPDEVLVPGFAWLVGPTH
jgi:hypothetical protein